MPNFIAVATIDPAANEIRGFRRDTQEEAEAMAAQNSRPNIPWLVFEMVECARTIVEPVKLVRSREPAPRQPATIEPTVDGALGDH